jgi:LacI family transcriptional regulator
VGFIGSLLSSEAICIHYSTIKTFSGNPNYMAGKLAAEHLVELGHKKMACITGPLEVGLFRDRLRGFKETLLNYGIHLEDTAIYEGEPEYATGKDAVDYFILKKIDITALWAECDLAAIGAMEQFKRNKMSIPDDISIIGMDDIEISKIVYPSLTTVAQPFPEMCDVAVQFVLDQKNGIEITEKKVVLKPKLIIRESTKRTGIYIYMDRFSDRNAVRSLLEAAYPIAPGLLAQKIGSEENR